MANNSFVLYKDFEETINILTDEQAGRIFKAIFEYERTGEIPELDQILKVTFIPIKQSLDRNGNKWAEECNRRKEAGKLGGEAKARNAKNNVANVASAKSSTNFLANVADNDSVNEYENVNEREPVNENDLNITSIKEEAISINSNNLLPKEDNPIKNEDIISFNKKINEYNVLLPEEDIILLKKEIIEDNLIIKFIKQLSYQRNEKNKFPNKDDDKSLILTFYKKGTEQMTELKELLIEKKYVTPKGDSFLIDFDDKNELLSLAELENYIYFQDNKIRKSLKEKGVL